VSTSGLRGLTGSGLSSSWLMLLACQQWMCSSWNPVGVVSRTDILAVASVLGFGHEIWNATLPQARSLDELNRIEHAITESAAG
jgi:hypothetical protein